MNNHYKTLDISRHATPAEIKQSYRRLASKWHPDKWASDPAYANTMMRQINDAYKVLGDPVSRSQYDAWLDSEEATRAHQEPPKAEPSQKHKDPVRPEKTGWKRFQDTLKNLNQSSFGTPFAIFCVILAISLAIDVFQNNFSKEDRWITTETKTPALETIKLNDLKVGEFYNIVGETSSLKISHLSNWSYTIEFKPPKKLNAFSRTGAYSMDQVRDIWGVRENNKPRYVLISYGCAGNSSECARDNYRIFDLKNGTHSKFGIYKSTKDPVFYTNLVLFEGVYSQNKLGDDLIHQEIFMPEQGFAIDKKLLKNPLVKHVNQHPEEFFKDIDARKVFLDKLRPEEFLKWRQYSAVSGGSDIFQGRYLFLSGCKQHACNTHYAKAMIDMKTNDFIVKIFENKKLVNFHGALFLSDYDLELFDSLYE